MKKLAIAAALSATLAGCFGPGDPIVLPDGDIEAAKTCFAAAGYVLRVDAEEGDSVTYEQLLGSFKYPMAAAARIEPFDVENTNLALDGIEAEMERVAPLDYVDGVKQCDARFGITDAAPTLPETDRDALLACTGMSGFIGGALDEGDEVTADKAAEIMTMANRLAERLDADPEIILMSQEDFDELFSVQLKSAFAAGNPDGYIESCKTRFPAE